MKKQNDELVAAQLGLVLTMAIADKLGEADLLDIPETEEAKLEVCRKGLAVIDSEVERAFKPTEEAQRMKLIVIKDLYQSHYEYFGLKYEESSEVTFKAE